MTGAILTNVRSTHFTPFFALPADNYTAATNGLTKGNIANYFTINLYNSKSADNNIIRFAAFDKATVTDGATTYTQGSTKVTFDLYRSVEIQVIGADGVVKNYVKWIKHNATPITVTTDGAIVTVKDLPAAYYKAVPVTNDIPATTVVNVSFWDETKATTTALTKYNYGSPDCEINNKYYAAPTSENLVLPTA